MPFDPTSAAALVTLRSPAPVVEVDQAENEPFSKPSAKIRSEEIGVGVGVFVAVPVGVFVGVLVAVPVGVLVGVFVGVFVGVLVGVAVGVFVGVLVGVFVGVPVGVGVPSTQTASSSSTVVVVVLPVSKPSATNTRPSGNTQEALRQRATFMLATSDQELLLES